MSELHLGNFCFIVNCCLAIIHLIISSLGMSARILLNVRCLLFRELLLQGNQS